MQQGSVEESSSNFLLQVAVENLSPVTVQVGKKGSSSTGLPYLFKEVYLVDSLDNSLFPLNEREEAKSESAIC